MQNKISQVSFEPKQNAQGIAVSNGIAPVAGGGGGA